MQRNREPRRDMRRRSGRMGVRANSDYLQERAQPDRTVSSAAELLYKITITLKLHELRFVVSEVTDRKPKEILEPHKFRKARIPFHRRGHT